MNNSGMKEIEYCVIIIIIHRMFQAYIADIVDIWSRKTDLLVYQA